ncbi:MAG: transaldolase [Desulfobacteraceae bacterium]|jgi:transaldolase|nr:transaldolase [Desulfobacteraceae bacterium]
MSKLNQLKAMTTVVADTGDIESIRRFQPVDATTNPTLLLKAAQQPDCQPKLMEAIKWASDNGGADEDFLQKCTEKFTISIGKDISQIVPGRVSTEVDARLSFDTQAMIDKARQLIDHYAEAGVSSDRILIKLASTWEGIRAAEVLEKSGIQCNLTLLFCFVQAVACADAGVTLISPFVGRIYDWYQKNFPDQLITSQNDPGVKSVREIYQYYKAHGYQTIVMGASFRNVGQIEELAGCDNLTVSPDLLEILAADEGVLERKLFPDVTRATDSPVQTDEKGFRWQLNEDPMATEKLAEGIRSFALNQLQLEELVQQMAS